MKRRPPLRLAAPPCPLEDALPPWDDETPADAVKVAQSVVRLMHPWCRRIVGDGYCPGCMREVVGWPAPP